MNHTHNEPQTVPLSQRYALTIQEAARFTHIGEKRLRRLVAECPEADDFVLYSGNRALLKRERLMAFLDARSSV